MTVCGSGFVLVLDRAGQVLARTWCLYECATALRRYGQNRFRMAAPSECHGGGTGPELLPLDPCGTYPLRGGRPCSWYGCV